MAVDSYLNLIENLQIIQFYTQMNDEKFLALDKISETIHNKFEELQKKGEFIQIEAEIQDLLETLKERYSIDFNFSLEIFDSEREKSMQMYRIGITGSGNGRKTYRHTEGYSFDRYLFDGNIVEIPHCYCPNCWSEWDFKSKGSSCPECGMTFGKEVKLLLDSNDCPMCTNGKVSQKSPHCSKCEFIASDDLVIWG